MVDGATGAVHGDGNGSGASTSGAPALKKPAIGERASDMAVDAGAAKLSQEVPDPSVLAADAAAAAALAGHAGAPVDLANGVAPAEVGGLANGGAPLPEPDPMQET